MTLLNFIYRFKLHHVFFWLILFGGWYFFRYQDFSSRNVAILVTFIKVIDLAFMVYIVNYLMIPQLLYRKKYVLFGVLFFCFVCISSVFKIYLVEHILYQWSNFSIFNANFKERVYDNVIPHFLLVSTGAAFKLLADHAKAQRRLGEMAKEKAEAELGFLKSQINPHFLFNSLNSVYFLIDKNNSDAREALHKFSEMLRYQLYEIKGQKIPIEKEIGFINDYIYLQRLRREDNCQVMLNIEQTSDHLFIEPLLLVPFVENSFKHLSHYGNGKMNEIKIELSSENSVITFTVRNTTEPESAREFKPEGGIGLSNVKRRLELLYPQRHVLDIVKSEGWFNINLKLELNHGT